MQGRKEIEAARGSLEEYAARAVAEYNLHKSGISYELQGYVTDEGYVPAWKLDEHLLIDRLMSEAIDDLKKRGR